MPAESYALAFPSTSVAVAQPMQYDAVFKICHIPFNGHQ